MSNRDGKGAKGNAGKTRFRKGGVCKECGKGKYEPMKKLTAGYFMCPKCYDSNY